jgi:hypothetical protein
MYSLVFIHSSRRIRGSIKGRKGKRKEGRKE